MPRRDLKRFRIRGCDGMGQGFPRELSPPFGCRWAEQPARRGFAQDRPSPVSVAAPAPRDAVTDRGATVPGAKKSVNAPPSVAVVSTGRYRGAKNFRLVGPCRAWRSVIDRKPGLSPSPYKGDTAPNLGFIGTFCLSSACVESFATLRICRSGVRITPGALISLRNSTTSAGAPRCSPPRHLP